MLAVGQSLATCGRANALDIAAHMAGVFQPGSPARYMPYTGLALEGLAAGAAQELMLFGGPDAVLVA